MRAEASPERRVRPSGADVRHRRRLQETAALISAALGLFFLLSLISYHPLDVASTAYADVAHDRANLGGRLGAWAAEYLLQTLGLSVFWIPVLWFLLAYRWAVESGPTAEWTWLGFLMTVLSTAGLIGLWLPTFRLTVQVGDDLLPVEMAGGGWLGQTLARYGREWVGPWGATAAGTLGTLIGLSLVTSWPPGTVLRRCGQWVYARGRLLWTAYRGHRQRRALERLHRPAGRTGIPGTPPQEASPRTAAVESPETPMDVTPEDVPPVAIVEKKRPVLQAERAWRPKPPAEKPEPLPGPLGSEEIDELEREARRWYEQARQGRSGEDYVLPPYQMLAPAENHEGPSPKELAETARIIQAKLAEFDIEGEITRAISGPVVTTFEFRPAPGVKISRIQGLAEDLALALGTESVRIDRIVHESAIGIEVPNRQRSVIALREVVESEIFLHSRMPMTIALGQTVHGEPYVTSLLKMPHLLIAGATGSGKSVALNCIIVSLLLKHTPDEVRLVLIDPKHVELKLYNGIPHLLTPVITDAQKAAAALKWLTREMEERQRQLALLTCGISSSTTRWSRLSGDAAWLNGWASNTPNPCPSISSSSTNLPTSWPSPLGKSRIPSNDSLRWPGPSASTSSWRPSGPPSTSSRASSRPTSHAVSPFGSPRRPILGRSWTEPGPNVSSAGGICCSSRPRVTAWSASTELTSRRPRSRRSSGFGNSKAGPNTRRPSSSGSWRRSPQARRGTMRTGTTPCMTRPSRSCSVRGRPPSPIFSGRCASATTGRPV